ncbi:hypothetical protein [Streptomyces sp. CC208A]|uniref:hypothetical protein n=1 Tax=Streptomyces sp. CC208A TaxID=3044573 RepID=UPI0024A9E382|nr:hypothetical protein [Streptomyces sp. CC208A]
MNEPTPARAPTSCPQAPPQAGAEAPHAAGPKDRRPDRYNWELARGPITAFGEAKALSAWANDPRCAVSREALRTRLALGWLPEDAITRERHDRPVLEYTYQGRTLTLRGWAEQAGIKYHTLYRRLTAAGMTFEEALLKGSDGPDFTLPVIAFGETKPLSRWAVDPRAGCTVTTMRRRIAEGWEPEQAITEQPHNRTTLGSGVPHRAFGLSMGLEDWARHTQIPVGTLRQVMDHHGLPLESTLHALGWSPHVEPGTVHDLIAVPPEHLRPGDRILGVSAADGPVPVFTVRRPSPPSRSQPRASGPLPAPLVPASVPGAPARRSGAEKGRRP